MMPVYHLNKDLTNHYWSLNWQQSKDLSRFLLILRHASTSSHRWDSSSMIVQNSMVPGSLGALPSPSMIYNAHRNLSVHLTLISIRVQHSCRNTKERIEFKKIVTNLSIKWVFYALRYSFMHMSLAESQHLNYYTNVPIIWTTRHKAVTQQSTYVNSVIHTCISMRS